MACRSCDSRGGVVLCALGTTVSGEPARWYGGKVRAALPFLRQSGKAVILFTDIVEPGRAADPQRLAGYLEWHGITASIRQVTVGHRQVSDALIEDASGAGCDLLVMGAYGHSRVRELVLGGVTQDMLRRDTSLPILVAH